MNNETKQKQNGLDVLGHYFKKLVSFEWNDLTWTGRAVALTARCFLLFWVYVLYGNYVAPFIENFSQESLSAVPQEAAIVQAFEENNELVRKGGADKYIFINQWSARNKDSYLVGRDGAVSLSDMKTSARFDYGGEVPVRSNFGFSFVSEGVYGPNLVVGRPEFWEITIGDKSTNVVTLKSTNKIGGALTLAEETNWKKLKPESNAFRPRTNECLFETGEEVRVEIIEHFITDTKQFKIDVTVTCNNMQSDTLSWLFAPPPKWLALESLYLAIIDLDGGNQTKIHFINPPIIELLE